MWRRMCIFLEYFIGGAPQLRPLKLHCPNDALTTLDPAFKGLG
jgi:hypothetical protein